MDAKAPLRYSLRDCEIKTAPKETKTTRLVAVVVGVLVALAAILFVWLHPGLPASNPEVVVRIRYEAAGPDDEIHYTVVISGADKHHWYGIPSGKTQRVTLRPGVNADSGVILFYQLRPGGETRVWVGAAPWEDVGYRTDIVVHLDGRVSAVFKAQYTFRRE